MERHKEDDSLASNISRRIRTGALPTGTGADEDLVGDSPMRRWDAGEKRGAER